MSCPELPEDGLVIGKCEMCNRYGHLQHVDGSWICCNCAWEWYG